MFVIQLCSCGYELNLQSHAPRHFDFTRTIRYTPSKMMLLCRIYKWEKISLTFCPLVRKFIDVLFDYLLSANAELTRHILFTDIRSVLSRHWKLSIVKVGIYNRIDCLNSCLPGSYYSILSFRVVSSSTSTLTIFLFKLLSQIGYHFPQIC